MIWVPNSRWHTTSTPKAREERKERDRKIGRGREQRYLLWDTDYLCDKEAALRKFQPTILLLKEDEHNENNHWHAYMDKDKSDNDAPI